ncbi:MAG: beta-ketoacyl synthase [Opitutae bacterium]|nr:beta-ketoacyl synthase [Opitutae bacterium]
MHKVYITGIGFVTSIGNDCASVEHSLRALTPGIGLHPEMQDDPSPAKVAGIIKDFDVSSVDPEDWEYPERYQVRRDVIRSFSPHVLYAYCSMKQAIDDANLGEEDVSNPDCGLYTASGGSMRSVHKHLEKMDQRGVMACNPLAIVASVAGTLSFNLVAIFGIRGFSAGMVSACASSGHALGFAFDEVRRGRQKRMLVVGGEDCNFESIVPFAGMRALSLDRNPATASRPFDKTRNGFVGSGGATCLVLESEEETVRRGATPYCEMIGWGQASDGYNVAISHPEGRGLRDAITHALKDASITAQEVDYVNAHAPSTPIGDASELQALKAVFPAPQRVKLSSTKALTGHGLSLSSIMEAGFCSLALQKGFLPGSANVKEPDPEIGHLDLITESEDTQAEVALSNSSGFGGANVSILLRRFAG